MVVKCPLNWKSYTNTPSYTSFWEFFIDFVVENPNLRSLGSSNDLQIGGYFRLHPLKHVGCLILGCLE